VACPPLPDDDGADGDTHAAMHDFPPITRASRVIRVSLGIRSPVQIGGDLTSWAQDANADDR
jgi:hypothetical protein